MGDLLRGKVAIVTGAGSGIGKAAARRFAAEGASVLAVDLDEAALGWTEEDPRVAALAGSVADLDTNRRMVERAVEVWGRLDIAFFNAGVPALGSILDSSLEGFERSLAVNLTGVVHGVRAAAPAMLESGGGSIVVTASTSALVGDIGNWAYNAAKAGVLNMVRSVAGELAPRGIRVNAVCPGPTRTAMVERHLELAPEFYDVVRGHVPMLRWGDPAEVANAALWLASDEASFVTGIALPVDGGVSALSPQFGIPQPEPLATGVPQRRNAE